MIDVPLITRCLILSRQICISERISARGRETVGMKSADLVVWGIALIKKRGNKIRSLSSRGKHGTILKAENLAPSR